MPGALRRGKAAQLRRCARGMHRTVAKGIRQVERKRATLGVRRHLHPTRDDRIDILPLAKVGRDRDIGDRAREPIVEGRDTQGEAREWLQVEAPLEPAQPLQSERGIGLGGDGKDDERPVQLVQRR
ncbi:hypothetical protein D9M73_232990 [compost metagenome]